RALRASGYHVERLENVDQQGKARQAEVGPPPKRGRAPAARMVAGHRRYLNVVEVEAAIAAAAAPPNDGFTSLIPLPNKTWGNRTCHALRIAHGTGASRPGIYFLGGVHAREWGSSDILISFVQQLTEAYRTHSGIRLGSQAFTAAQIRTVIDAKDIYVFPQA